MNEVIFRYVVIGLLCGILSSIWVLGGVVGTINGTTEYLAMKAREQAIARSR